jgi:hypothetical protein
MLPVPLGNQPFDFTGFDELRKSMIKDFLELFTLAIIRKYEIAIEFQKSFDCVV